MKEIPKNSKMDLKKIPYDFNPNITFPAYLVRNRLLKGISKYAPELKGDLLDFGCGSKPYKSLFTVNSYTGVDIENPGHSHDNEQIDFYYDGSKLPFEDNRFDAVFTTEVFEHVFNLPDILPDINRVMKPGGYILITCPFAICEHEQPTDFARYSSFGLTSLLQKNGFEIVQFEKLGNSVETVTQLWIMYLHINVHPLIKKIPVVRSAFRIIGYTLLNAFAILWSKIFPEGKELYLNNLALCKKVNDLRKDS